MATNDPARNRLIQQILEKGGKDPVFRKRLLEDPGAAIRDHFGIHMVPNFRIRFIEKPADLDLLVVLPDARDESELSPDMLDEVAGGTDDPPMW